MSIDMKALFIKETFGDNRSNITVENFVDKSDWPMRGEWNDEPDRVQWTDETTGLPCLIVRGPSGALCGYVAVENGHPYYEIDCADWQQPHDLRIHGGVSYSDKCQENGRICHLPEPGKPDDVWWIGFDCAHSGDVSPAYDKQHWSDSYYKSIGYVKSECESLAAQLIGIANK